MGFGVKREALPEGGFGAMTDDVRRNSPSTEVWKNPENRSHWNLKLSLKVDYMAAP
jgi:hypothetical protein